jgi:hypothetical protein
LRKAKSEALAADDLHEDCLIDLFLMRNKKTNKTDFVIHIDATGKVIRPIEQCAGKRVFYYCMVFQIYDYILPFSEFI